MISDSNTEKGGVCTESTTIMKDLIQTYDMDAEITSMPNPEGAFKPSTFLKTLWLFTESDFATFVIPDTVFGIFGALSGSLLTTNDSPNIQSILLMKLPMALIYNWGNLLIFDLANQRLPDSVLEDSMNKPWRPLPSGRIGISQTRQLLLYTLPLVLMVNWLLDAWVETALLFMLTWMYNDLRGGDDNFITRNAIIGVAFGLYNGGSLKIATGADHEISLDGYKWTALISGVIFTTMHIQDMKDQAGDKLRERKTAPLVLGDGAARWTIAIPIFFWSVFCPLFLGMGYVGYILSCGTGYYIALRLIFQRSVKADRKSWKMWTAWTALLYFLPLLHSIMQRGSSSSVAWI